MPKRIPTPPTDNNTIYFTAVSPYPLNANWEVKADQITFSRWIASFIPKATLIAIMYKPTARGMVLIEVDRAFTEHHILLGMHEWSKFLKRPTAEEAHRTTQIYYSTYNNHRAAQKDGWKTIHVVDSWFDGWPPRNSPIRNPYPKTAWCDLPPEDKTNKNMCRPLPVAYFPPPEKAAKPVVGSGAWVDSLNTPSPYSPEVQRTVWNRGPPSLPVRKSASTTTPIVPVRANPASATRAPTNVWGSQKPATLSPSSSAPAPTPVKAPQGVWAARSSAVASSSKISNPSTAPQRPPGLTASRSSAPSAPPGLTRGGKGRSGSIVSSSSSSELDWASEVAAASAIDSNSRYEQLVSETEELIVSDSLEKALNGDEDQDPEVFDVGLEMSSTSVPVYQAQQEDIKENLWSNYVPPAEKEEELCPVHGVVCSKGICQAASKKEREKRDSERLGRGGSRGRSRGRGRGGRGRSRVAGGRAKGNDDRQAAPRPRADSTGGSTSSPASSNPVSRANSVIAPVPTFNHDDDEDPWGD
ncbi:hypothetical protein GYMLUDRAFT_73705 [Collybiopsis luxurians FD-317 M1]|uniref:Uncharacterized protein n=1 Tax=Collybiopsis luxurians FD-317 M1 TaxID=944289 RepID=A0A0D0CEI2_9AGAR|nr:hypothetical protein GYMLUDRAFT_73705 [Collybiopsis luxurians FD-317 M1]